MFTHHHIKLLFLLLVQLGYMMCKYIYINELKWTRHSNVTTTSREKGGGGGLRGPMTNSSSVKVCCLGDTREGGDGGGGGDGKEAEGGVSVSESQLLIRSGRGRSEQLAPPLTLHLHHHRCCYYHHWRCRTCLCCWRVMTNTDSGPAAGAIHLFPLIFHWAEKCTGGFGSRPYSSSTMWCDRCDRTHSCWQWWRECLDCSLLHRNNKDAECLLWKCDILCRESATGGCDVRAHGGERDAHSDLHKIWENALSYHHYKPVIISSFTVKYLQPEHAC